ncbi:DeoR family transcriptional regulator [Corynebacterium guaraldiae]|uniref:DeoR family transcriptional regulator n=1 Tax=Corynebacterium guaraldiae TaxID=3051103 RepID=UPI002095EA6B|nr:DeoR family transcriptional regulator [Corynebacterium guaraldiae]
MDKEERQRRIIWAVDSGSKTVSQLQELTGASAITIRRDLTALEEVGALERFHGGARPAVRRAPAIPWRYAEKRIPPANGRLLRRLPASLNQAPAYSLTQGQHQLPLPAISPAWTSQH